MNVFGERQNPEKFIPGVVSAVRDGKQVHNMWKSFRQCLAGEDPRGQHTDDPRVAALHPCEGRGEGTKVHPVSPQGIQEQRYKGIPGSRKLLHGNSSF